MEGKKKEHPTQAEDFLGLHFNIPIYFLKQKKNRILISTLPKTDIGTLVT